MQTPQPLSPGNYTTNPVYYPTNQSTGMLNQGDQIGGIVSDASLIEIAQRFIVIAFILAGFLSAIFIFYGGISFILSGGNDEKIKKAINTIRYAIIGLVITIMSFLFVSFITRILFNFDLVSYMSPEFLIQSIKDFLAASQSSGNSYTIPQQ
jgi:hypothetical protein